MGVHCITHDACIDVVLPTGHGVWTGCWTGNAISASTIDPSRRDPGCIVNQSSDKIADTSPFFVPSDVITSVCIYCTTSVIEFLTSNPYTETIPPANIPLHIRGSRYIPRRLLRDMKILVCKKNTRHTTLYTEHLINAIIHSIHYCIFI